jgi:hypothetical protein
VTHTSTEQDAATQAVCYRHPGRETAVSCSNCDRPICPDCMVYSPVGIKCPECARQPRSALVRMKPNRAARAIAVAVGLGALMGVGIVFLQAVGLFFALILGWLIGIGMGEAVLSASGRFRGRETGLIAIGGCIWAYLFPYILFYGADVGSVADSLSRAPFVVLGAAIAGYVAYNRVQ